ncbi:MAG TPA: hypothetical protein VE959_21020 [Bryobacteraceae bacterium]|nr:hypothetical protein [Bryobacteraceae bacterium]
MPLFVELFLLGCNLFAELGYLVRLDGALRQTHDREQQGERQERANDPDEFHASSWITDWLNIGIKRVKQA